MWVTLLDITGCSCSIYKPFCVSACGGICKKESIWRVSRSVICVFLRRTTGTSHYWHSRPCQVTIPRLSLSIIGQVSIDRSIWRTRVCWDRTTNHNSSAWAPRAVRQGNAFRGNAARVLLKFNWGLAAHNQSACCKAQWRPKKYHSWEWRQSLSRWRHESGEMRCRWLVLWWVGRRVTSGRAGAD